MTRSSEQLERQAEATRAELSDTLEELRSRVSASYMVDQVVHFARDGGGSDFFRNLGRQMRDNPIPVVLMGASMALLMTGAGSTRNRRWSLPNRSGAMTSENISDYESGAIGEYHAGSTEHHGGMRERVSDAASRVSGMASSASSGASSAMRSASDTAASAYRGAGQAASSAASALHSAADTASSAFHTAAETASSTLRSASDAASHLASTTYRGASGTASRLASSASSMGRRTADVSKSMAELAREQPLVLGGIGLALGALLGAMMPRTQTEDQLMGETADQLKEQATDIASQQFERGRAAAESVFEHAKEEAQSVFEHAKQEAQSVVQQAAEDVQRRGLLDSGQDEKEIVTTTTTSTTTEEHSIVPTGGESELEKAIRDISTAGSGRRGS